MLCLQRNLSTLWLNQNNGWFPCWYYMFGRFYNLDKWVYFSFHFLKSCTNTFFCVFLCSLCIQWRDADCVIRKWSRVRLIHMRLHVHRYVDIKMTAWGSGKMWERGESFSRLKGKNERAEGLEATWCYCWVTIGVFYLNMLLFSSFLFHNKTNQTMNYLNAECNLSWDELVWSSVWSGHRPRAATADRLMKSPCGVLTVMLVDSAETSDQSGSDWYLWGS